jgi:cytochrome b561
VLAFGFIDFSALAMDDEDTHRVLLQLHGYTAILLMMLIVIHGLERYRKIFTNDGSP